jgi:hypothetical protein
VSVIVACAVARSGAASPALFCVMISALLLFSFITAPAVLRRLPIGSGTDSSAGGASSVRKEARIPQPWRLQLPLPRPPCRPYFLRLDLHRNIALRTVR